MIAEPAQELRQRQGSNNRYQDGLRSGSLASGVAGRYVASGSNVSHKNNFLLPKAGSLVDDNSRESKSILRDINATGIFPAQNDSHHLDI